MKRIAWLSVMGSLAIASASLAPAAQAAAQDTSARLMVVQAVPDQSLRVVIDDETVGEVAETGDVLGPFTVPAGAHEVTFLDESGEVVVDTTVELEPASVQDLVVHRPAEVGGDPVATLYATPTDTIAAGKARVLIAHTASVAPADVRLDGTVVFRNIANGEFATADVPAGEHVVALFPTGETTDPILGPLTVELVPQTVTMVYAMGDPDEDTMELVAHSARLASDGSLVPSMIGTGSAGLAADIRVSSFGVGPS